MFNIDSVNVQSRSFLAGWPRKTEMLFKRHCIVRSNSNISAMNVFNCTLKLCAASCFCLQTTSPILSYISLHEHQRLRKFVKSVTTKSEKELFRTFVDLETLSKYSSLFEIYDKMRQKAEDLLLNTVLKFVKLMKQIFM